MEETIKKVSRFIFDMVKEDLEAGDPDKVIIMRIETMLSANFNKE